MVTFNSQNLFNASRLAKAVVLMMAIWACATQAATLTVNSLADPGNDMVCDAVECTLAEAILTAASGDEVVFESALHGDILLNEFLRLERDITITGPGVGEPAITVDANGQPYVFINDLSSVTAVIKGLTVQGATSAGISNRGTLTLREMVVKDNGNAHTRYGSIGGGVLNVGTLTIEGSTIAENRARIGGGVAHLGFGSALIKNSSITANYASGSGAGIYNSVNASGSVNLEVENTTISGNRADSRGGGIYSGFGTVQVTNSTITENSSAEVAAVSI